MNYKKAIILGIMILVLAVVSTDLAAQCPMCRMSAESNLANGGTAGRGLNAGILYMLSMPYLLVLGVGIWWWRNRRREGDSEPIEPLN